MNTLTLTVLKELDALVQHTVSQHDHVLRHVLYEGEEAAFCVEPRVCTKFLLVWLQTLDHARYAKLVVALGTV